jgi:hypothetical protein
METDVNRMQYSGFQDKISVMVTTHIWFVLDCIGAKIDIDHLW